MEVGPPVMSFLIDASYAVQSQFGDGRLHRPLERIDRADDKHGSAAVPSYLPQHTMSVLRRARLKGPGCVCPQLGGNSAFAQHSPRLFIPGDHQRIPAITRTHLYQERVHVTSLSAISNRELVFRRGDAK